MTTKTQSMSGIDCLTSRVSSRNTFEYTKENGDRVIRFHMTDIVIIAPDGRITLNSGGWKTVTTKARMNDHISPWCVFQENNEWYVSKSPWSKCSETYHYHDGITITGDTCNGVLRNKDKDKQAKKIRRSVKVFAKAFIAEMKAGNVPAPSAGDCFICSMVDKDGVSWGEHSNHDDHILSHIKEKYYVPSLLMRAVNRHPVSPVAMNCIAGAWNNPDNIDITGYWYDIGWGSSKSLSIGIVYSIPATQAPSLGRPVLIEFLIVLQVLPLAILVVLVLSLGRENEK